MNPEDVTRARAEATRILEEYRRRAVEIDRDRYAAWQPDVAFAASSRTSCAAKLLHTMNAFPTTETPCLEVGYGSLGWLGVLIGWGVREQSLHGIELDAERAAAARAALPGAA